MDQIRQQIREEVKSYVGDNEGEDFPDTPPSQKKAAGRGRRFKQKIDEDISLTGDKDDPEVRSADLSKDRC